MTSPAPAQHDAQLIDDVRAHDPAALTELRRRHGSDAVRTARTLAHDDDEAERAADAAFDKLCDDLAAGGGPRHAVAPYLHTVARRAVLDTHRTARDDHEAADAASVEDLPCTSDPLSDVEQRNVVREAYESLPERWQRALWFTEIENRTPASLVPDLGGAAKAVAATAYRAREGLRQAYLAVHMSLAVEPGCGPVVTRLPAYVREALPDAEDVAVAVHLDTCLGCRNRRYELLLLVSNLRGVLAPALLGYSDGRPAATRPVTGLAVAAGPRKPIAGALAAAGTWPRRAVKVTAVAAVCLLSAGALAWAATSAFAPATDSGRVAGTAAGVRSEPLTVTFEQAERPSEMNPAVLLAGLPTGPPGDDAAEDEETAAVTGPRPSGEGRADQAAQGSGPGTSGPAGSDDDTDTSGSTPVDDNTTGPAQDPADGEDTSTGDESGPGGDQDPPADAPAPPAGNDGSSGNPDEPSVPDDVPEEVEPGPLERLLCSLPILC